MTRRADRVADAIKEEIAQLIVHGVKDPRIGFVSITGVQMSPDLRHARIFFTVHGDEKVRKQSLAGLVSASGYIRKEIGRRLSLRVVPEIVFEFDEGLEELNRVAKLLREVLPEERDDS